ncbi:MAG: cysteine--tRNA ligase [Alphaproteobacteria bacterium]|nr:cysteine--tRNA ligase [Alphaproteobacteria bacterium]
MSALFLTNNLTRRKEKFAPADPERVTMYVCGPTVYNYAHIGNARPPVVFDVLYRLLRRTYGADHVIYARNYTDIDDRIIAKAQEEGVAIEEITARYARIYEEDTAALGVIKPGIAPRATEHVGDMIAMIETLIASGAAYRTQSGVYFSVDADADYGGLSNWKRDDAVSGTRIAGEEDKRTAYDFALWKAAKPGEPAWEAPFGRGRPGWHIECSAMIEEKLGSPIDIHGGGVDLLFPHHENEIAQTRCAHGRPLARFWLHNGFLTLEDEKMSKSLGNVVLIHELLKEWPGEVLRLALLSAHYREPLNWTGALLEQTKTGLNRLYGALQRVKDAPDTEEEAPAAFLDALMDDLNTPKAIAELFALATAANTAKPNDQPRVKAQFRAAAALMGILQHDPDAWFRAGAGDQAEKIDGLVAERVAARAAKNWPESDRIRDALTAMGVEVMDGPNGSTWRMT